MVAEAAMVVVVMAVETMGEVTTTVDTGAAQ